MTETRTIIVYEAPHRILKTLTDLKGIFGDDHQNTVAREITKRYEELWRGTLEDAI